MTAPRNARPQPSGGRKYVWRCSDGSTETYTSVTTILNRVLAKPAIMPWALKVAGEYVRDHLPSLQAVHREDPDAVVQLVKGAPWSQRDAAAERGTLVHALAEAFTLGQTPRVTPELAGHLAMWKDWVATKHVKFLMSEATVYSRQMGYAGTLDAIAETDDGLLLIDYKTSKDVYPEAAYQLSAYACADFVGLPDGTEQELPSVDGLAVVRLAEDDWDMVPVALCPVEWSAILVLYRASERHNLIGASLGGPGRML